MTTLTAMKQALAALEDANGVRFNDEDDGPVILDYSAPIADLRAAIAELEQTQPVAWIYQNANTNHEYLVWKRSPGGRNWRALYTAPPVPAIPAGWQPIETAPAGDELILIGCINNGRILWADAGKRGKGSLTGCYFKPFGKIIYVGTHWMPLPQPPKEAT